MPEERVAAGGFVASLGRIALGPWPLYPKAIAVLVAYGMLIRAIVRALSQGVDGKPWQELLLPNLLTVVVRRCCGASSTGRVGVVGAGATPC